MIWHLAFHFAAAFHHCENEKHIYLSLLNMVNSIQMSSNQFRIEFSEFHPLQNSNKFRNKRNFVILSCQFQKILAEFRTFCTKLKNSQCPPLSNHLWNSGSLLSLGYFWVSLFMAMIAWSVIARSDQEATLVSCLSTYSIIQSKLQSRTKSAKLLQV